MERDDERARERAAEELQREIDAEVRGEPEPLPAHPSLRDLFRERMLHPPPEGSPPEGEEDGGE